MCVMKLAENGEELIGENLYHMLLLVAMWCCIVLQLSIFSHKRTSYKEKIQNALQFQFFTSQAWLGDPQQGVGGKITGPTGQKWGPTGGDHASSGIAFLGPSTRQILGSENDILALPRFAIQLVNLISVGR